MKIKLPTISLNKANWIRISNGTAAAVMIVSGLLSPTGYATDLVFIIAGLNIGLCIESGTTIEVKELAEKLKIELAILERLQDAAKDWLLQHGVELPDERDRSKLN